MIQWTDEERSKIVSQFMLSYGKDQHPTDRLIRDAANRVLPPERQRNHISPFDPVKRLLAQQQGRPWDEEAIRQQMREDRKRHARTKVKRHVKRQPRLSEDALLNAARTGVHHSLSASANPNGVATLQQPEVNKKLLMIAMLAIETLAGRIND